MMRAIASYIMRGPFQAVLVTVVCGVLSLILLPFSHLSGAAIALVTLRQGIRQGLIVIGGSMLVTAIIAFIALGQPKYAIGFALIMWLPMLYLAAVLRTSISLPKTLIASVAIGWLSIAATYMVLDEPGVWWYETVIDPMFKPLLEEQAVDDEQRMLMQQYLQEYAEKMTGYLAVMLMYFHVFTLIIARWWQSLLYNPGGFKTEFQSLKLGRTSVIVLIVLGAVTILSIDTISVVAGHLAMVLFALFAVQGLSIAHHVAGKISNGTPWLVATYVLMFFFWHIVSLAGVVDNWVDLRNFPRKKQQDSE